MAISYVGANGFDGNSGTATTTFPAGIVAGDVSILAVWNTNSVSIPLPSGWTSIQTISGANNLLLAYKVYVPGDTAPVFTGFAGVRVTLGTWRGCAASPIGVSASSYATGDPVVISSLALGGAPSVVVASYWMPSGNGTFGTPTGMTERYDAPLSGRGAAVSDTGTITSWAGSTASTGFPGGGYGQAVVQLIEAPPATDVAGLSPTIWYKPSSITDGIGANVTSWPGITGPTLSPFGTAPVNQGTYVNFTGGQLRTSNAIANLGDNFTVSIVMDVTPGPGAAAGMTWMYGEEVTGKRRSLYTVNQTDINFSGYNANVTTTADPTPKCIVTVRRTGTLVEVFKDRVLIGSGSPTLLAYTFAGFALGGNYSGTEAWTGRIYEIAGWNTALSDTDRHTADTDLGRRNGVIPNGISFVGQTTNASANQPTPYPAGIATGDLSLRYQINTGSAPTVPAGWTTVRQWIGSSYYHAVSTKIYTSGDATPGGAHDGGSAMMVFRGASGVGPSASLNHGGGVISWSSPALSLTTPSVIAGFQANDNSRTMTPPTRFTKTFETTLYINTSGFYTGIAQAQWPTATDGVYGGTASGTGVAVALIPNSPGLSYVGGAHIANNTISIPSGLVAGDLMILSGSNQSTLPSLPAGWTNIVTAAVAPQIRTCYRIYVPGDSSATMTSASEISIAVFRGADATTPIGVSSAYISAPAVNPVPINALSINTTSVVYAFGGVYSGTITGQSAGLTPVQNPGNFHRTAYTGPVTSWTGGTFTYSGSTNTGSTVVQIVEAIPILSTVATGGTITTSGPYTIHTFTSSGTFTVLQPRTFEALVVAGGGGGSGGGGGAGGFLTGTVSLSAGANAVTVGAGGAGTSPQGGANGASGSNSVFSTLTAIGGGGSGKYDTTLGASSGGSGGGGGSTSTVPTTGGAGTAGQGNAGGSVSSTYYPSPYPSAGGGGAGAVGNGPVNATTPGAGGAGLSSSITGSSVTYAGGGGGASIGGSGGAGGSGGGGAGTGINGSNGTAGTPNTGGGGGGGSAAGLGGTGGSGIVIIRYLTESFIKIRNSAEITFNTRVSVNRSAIR